VRFFRPLSWLLPWGTLVLAGAQDLRVGAFVESSELWVDLETRTRHDDVTLRPNFTLQPGVSLYYKGYGAALSPPTRGIARDDAEIPPSRYQDYRLFYYGSRWGVEGYLQSTRGYYSDPFADSTRLLHPSARADAAILNVYWAVRTRWLPDNRVSHMEDGLLKTGFRVNPLFLFSLSRHAVKARRPLLDTLDAASNSVFHAMEEASTYGAFAILGNSFNANLFGFYLDPALFVGFGLQYNATPAPRGYSEVDVGSKINLRLKTGYRMRWFDLGLLVQDDVTWWDIRDDETLTFDSVLIRAYLEVAAF
jgi:hypothetical protein